MSCPDDNLLVAMVEHTLDPHLFGELEVHIDSCAHCRQLVGALAGNQSLAVGTPGRSSRAEQARELAAHASVNDRYTIDAVLGRGGMGTVYLARDVTLGRDVALKLHLPGSGNDRLHREAIAMAKLAHPNVVTVFEIATIDDRLYVAMEYVRGGTLRGWLAAQPRSWREIVALLVEVGAGLAAAHAAGLVHRDFKPENVLVGEDGRPRVSDFGLARADGIAVGASELVRSTAIAIGSAPTIGITPPERGHDSDVTGPRAAMTETGAVLGTPAYMAPEQFAGGRVDARCDQFAFCVVAWECLFGKRPFTGATIAAIQLAIDEQAFAKPSGSEVPDRICRVLERGLSVAADARYADMPALLTALRTAALPRTRRRIALGSVLALGLAGTVLAVSSAWSSRRHEAACASEASEVRQMFGTEARARIKAALLATGLPYAQSAFDHSAPVIDRYVGVLAEQASAVCKGRDEPARMTAARRTCLADREAELTGLLDIYAHPTTDDVQRAPNAAWAIFDPAPCNDAHTLLAGPAVAAARSPELAARLSHTKALLDVGHAKDAVPLATSLLADARTRGDHTLELDTLLTLGELQDELDLPEAATSFHQAEALAETQGRDLEAAVALDSLGRISGLTRHDYVSAHRFVELAHAKLTRLGGDNLAITGQLLATEAQILMDELRFAEADTTIHRAVEVLEQIYGPDAPKVGSAIGIASEISHGELKHAQALKESKRTLEILERAFGDSHPSVAGAQLNLAMMLISVKQYDEARKRLLSADAGFMSAYGPDHPARVAVLGNLAELEQVQGHWDASLGSYREALGIAERTSGPGSPTASGIHHDIGRTLWLAGRLELALAEVLRALELDEKLGPDGESRLQYTLVDLAGIQLARSRPDLALPVAERALALATKVANAMNLADLADTRFTLARAMWGAHGDHGQARALAEQALAALTDPERRAPIERWLAQPDAKP